MLSHLKMDVGSHSFYAFKRQPQKKYYSQHTHANKHRKVYNCLQNGLFFDRKLILLFLAQASKEKSRHFYLCFVFQYS